MVLPILNILLTFSLLIQSNHSIGFPTYLIFLWEETFFNISEIEKLG